MSKSKSKGTFGENGVLGFVSEWFRNHEQTPEFVTSGYVLRDADAASSRYPLHLSEDGYRDHVDSEVAALLYEPVLEARSSGWDAEGIPFRKITSEGQNDQGDVAGPFTAIEVKNYRNPPVGALLTNAEWKARNSGKLYWFLCYKAAGKGLKSVGLWHAMMTVEELYTGFGVRPASDPSCTLERFLDLVEAGCSEGLVVDAAFSRPAPGRSISPHPWLPRLVMISSQAKMEENREAVWVEHRAEATPLTGRVAPFVVSPRRGAEGVLPVARWYVYTKLEVVCRSLETVGVLPVSEAEYVDPALADA